MVKGNMNSMMRQFGIDPNDIETRKLIKQQVKERSHYMIFKPDTVCEADLQFWSLDDGYRYLLVVVDVVSRKVDLEPLKDKTGETMVKAMKDIFTRGKISKYTKIVKTDPGSEFNNKVVKAYLNKIGIDLRTGVAGRKTQTAIVENTNLLISKLLAIKTTLEIAEGKTEGRKWVRYIPKLRDLLNQRDILVHPISHWLKEIRISKNCKILPIGTDVFVQLEKPRDHEGKLLTGRFRISDYRYEKTSRKIVNVLFQPDSPIRYMIEGLPNASYLRAQLLVDDK